MKKAKSIDDYSKEELFYELQKEHAINNCLQKEIQDIKEIIRMQNSNRNTNQLNVEGHNSIIVQN